MAKMLKKRERKSSYDSVNGFLNKENLRERVDIVIHEEKHGVTIFKGVLFEIEEECYPRDESAYSIKLYWKSYRHVQGRIDTKIFPQDPYKTYFDLVRIGQSENRLYLHFYNVYKVGMHIAIFKSSENGENESAILAVAKDFAEIK